MAIHKTTENASHISEIPSQYQGSFAVFSCHSILEEFQQLHDLLCNEYPTLKSSARMEDNEWKTLIVRLCSGFSLHFESNIYLDFLEQQTDIEIQALLHQLKRALASLRYTKDVVDHASSPTGLLLPVTFVNRIDMLLGGAHVPVVWVRQLDLLKF
ncbi:hypothetical protein [Aliivibrio wodanis]|uniref:hypothetical protein n=1 Tax=Aliivibrio wodanis TaxID=80852 RepID=UPI00406C970A